MAEAQAQKATPQSVSALGHTRIAGRIQGCRVKNTSDGKLFLTRFKLPAPDQYSSPSTVEVRSKERIGANDEEHTVIVRVGGYSRSYKADDGEGGKTTVATAENLLDFVGHA